MEPTLYHVLFRALDEMPEELLNDRAQVRALLEMEVESAGGFVSPRVEDFLDMLLDEYCAASSRAA
jgi:hypothetical protein